MKLKNIIIKKANCITLNSSEKKYFRVLDKYVVDIFPCQGVTNENLKKLLTEGKNKLDYNNLFPYLLPMHTNDSAWLAKYLDVSCHFLQMEPFLTDKKINSNKICQIPFNVIEKYIAESPKFEHYRSKYEQDVIKSCIEVTHDIEKTNNGVNNFAYDDYFRSRVIYNCLRLGIERTPVEKCLESNAHLWRKKVMYITFGNQMKINHPNYLNQEKRELLHKFNSEEWEGFVNKEMKYMHLWICKREYDYYQRHKNSINKVGTATRCMKLNKLDAYALEYQLQEEKEKYVAALNLVNEDLKDYLTYGIGF